MPIEWRHLTLAVCAPEASLRYKVFHPGKYDTNTKGICGIKDYWIDIIPELTEDNINSMYGGYLVIKHFMNKHNNKIYPAIKDYKGAHKNLEIPNKSYKIYKHLKEN